VRIDASHGRAPSRRTVWLCLFILLIIWALNFLVGKIALRYMPALTLGSFRLVLAGIFVLLIYPICRRMTMFSEAREARRQRRTRRDYWTFFYLAFFGVAVNQVCFTVGLRYTSVSHSAIIVGMGPIYALILAVLFRLERATLRKILGMSIALGGVFLMAAGPSLTRRSPTLLGDVITLAGSLGFALYAALGKRVAAQYDALTMTTYNFVFGALIVLPIGIHRAIAIGPLQNWRAIPWPAWAGMFYMGLLSSTLAYLLYFWLLRYLEVTQLAAYNYLLPVSATLLSILFLGERGSWLELLGAALALSGVYYIEAPRGSSSEPSPAVASPNG
jgi:drug/metabolite transporter (DMT)-like permease